MLTKLKLINKIFSSIFFCTCTSIHTNHILDECQDWKHRRGIQSSLKTDWVIFKYDHQTYLSVLAIVHVVSCAQLPEHNTTKYIK